ncbi:N-formylglutamate amidohydrolase [Rhodobacter capsulatus]|uniref:N-formylglutamate amidohydrolase n=1 Tax=Rhodobacter capsulatus (strain ATCC BAA-309 / NBRC 16581 / SB1003) TaxID=272942 RepID=D5ASP1_RHOCB|nr:N-formylglutamate amidohydrolase [Rhodobacter capsulatus]ADE87132.1 N-formylglutamate amidohydrolase [Rhodobacter capsulatus SB 1003]ETD03362.1 N-formylglutamate amidohydrolase [Rhodobacter capsulatus DE442]ETD78171.1 N-formylglutamate amidohydrolase [Rhodobacter capsulatus B6]ETD80157.1 N-formylglutamate amidohydrolase [Rhodobacter capsulatus R121]ETD91312.1 N-formylglutamate amidohydrolase [Rhodobacter capsulatus YW2]
MAEVSASIQPYRLHLPETLSSGVVFASPHSGRFYPADFTRRAQLDLLRLRSSEDAFVDRLLTRVPKAGATLIEAVYPRAFVDLNRAEDELDPALIEGVTRGSGGARVLTGLGVIPRVVAGGREIFRGKIPRAEAEDRLARIWRPYHGQLSGLLCDRHARFGRALLFDVHSMPSEAASGGPGPDIVLGDRFGASARAETSLAVEQAFRRAGLRVARNSPFAGAYVAQRYGRPAEGVEVLQIEIARALYMDEERIEPLPGFDRFAQAIGAVFVELADLIRGDARMAAE